MLVLSLIAAAVAALGVAQAAAGLLAVLRFRRQARRAGGSARPPVTILKPLHGDEPLLEQALETFCRQSYGDYQIVFGLQDPADPAAAVVHRLRARFPSLDLRLVVDPTPHGSNRKIANLINMLPAADHDILVIADSDVHVTPGYLERVVEALHGAGTGLVTAVYSGLPGRSGFAAALGATQISHVFLPGALMARALGRQDCLGATMALHRDTLASVGGFHAIAGHLADDAVLGHLVGDRGLKVSLAATIPATTVAETSLPALVQHELRWARTIRSQAPVGYALSVVQFPIFWASLCIALSGGQAWSVALFAATWAVRAVVARQLDRLLGLTIAAPIWLLPLRDLMSVSVMLASYRGREVHWRGQVLRVDRRRFARAERLAKAELQV